MKILLTGHEGFIGQNLKLWLTKQGHTLSLYEWGDEFPQVEGHDWLIHVGAISSTTETDVKKVMDQNVTSSIILFEEAIKHGVNFQFASSASVYGQVSSFAESDDKAPANLYAMSKHLVEEYMLARDPMNIRWQAFRYFNVYGPHEDHKGSQASPYQTFASQARTLGEVRVFEGSSQFKRDFISVEVLVHYHIEFMRSRASGIFNIGTGRTKSFLEVAEEVAEEHNVPIAVVPFPEHLRPHYQAFTRADMTKTSSILGV